LKLFNLILIVVVVLSVGITGCGTEEQCSKKSCIKKAADYDYLWTPDEHEGLVSIFNGEDFTGWKEPESKVWKVEDGCIAFAGPMDNKHREGGYIWTEGQYGDFILELEFKIDKGSNSGIFFRTADLNDPVQTGLEIQIADSYGRRDGKLEKYDCGAFYDCQAPFHNMAKKAGQWNKVVLICQDQKIYVAMNGTCVVSVDVNLWFDKPGKNPDGTKNKYKKDMARMPRYGHIGFQDHGCKVLYRNIKIRDLKNP